MIINLLTFLQRVCLKQQLATQEINWMINRNQVSISIQMLMLLEKKILTRNLAIIRSFQAWLEMLPKRRIQIASQWGGNICSKIKYNRRLQCNFLRSHKCRPLQDNPPEPIWSKYQMKIQICNQKVKLLGLMILLACKSFWNKRITSVRSDLMVSLRKKKIIKSNNKSKLGRKNLKVCKVH